MEYKFTPIDFPDYADLNYKQLRPLLMYPGKPPVGLVAEVLRGTLPRKKRRLFDLQNLDEIHTLIDNYVEFNITKEELLDDIRITDDNWGDTD